MPWTVPDKGEGDNDIQSILFQEYIDILMDGIAGKDCVLNGCGVSGGADMTPAVAKGAVLSNGILRAVTAGDVAIGTAHATLPRIDLVVADSAGAKQVRAGAAAAAPKPPARTADDVALAAVFVPPGDLAIASSQITDLRVMREWGAMTLYKTTAAEVTNNTAAAIHVLNKAASGVTIPNGLFLAGKILRVRLGGNMLLNSGTPTVTLAIKFGGTTMFQDTSAAAAASATRIAWRLDFDICAQANNDQSMTGDACMMTPTGTKAAPTTGIGDAWGLDNSSQESNTAIAGSSAVDCDAADRVLAVEITFNVANAANELVVEQATVELL